jgi:hypothetical protein
VSWRGECVREPVGEPSKLQDHNVSLVMESNQEEHGSTHKTHDTPTTFFFLPPVSTGHELSSGTIQMGIPRSGDRVEIFFCLLQKVDLKRIYIDECRYNERLNSKTEGSKTPHIHWVVR